MYDDAIESYLQVSVSYVFVCGCVLRGDCDVRQDLQSIRSDDDLAVLRSAAFSNTQPEVLFPLSRHIITVTNIPFFAYNT